MLPNELGLMPTVTAPSAARRWVRQHLDASGLQFLHDDATLLISELVTNAVGHGDGMVTLATYTDGSSITFAVGDASGAAPQVLEPHPDNVGGRGLHLVNELAGAWGCKVRADGAGKTVWFRLP